MPFLINIKFGGGLTKAQQAAFQTAADRWSQIITGDLPAVEIGGELIDDLAITAEGVRIDGRGGSLVRPALHLCGRTVCYRSPV